MRFDVAGPPCVMKFAWASITTQPFCSKPCLFSMKSSRTIFAKLTAVNCEVAICQDYCGLAHGLEVTATAIHRSHPSARETRCRSRDKQYWIITSIELKTSSGG